VTTATAISVSLLTGFDDPAAGDRLAGPPVVLMFEVWTPLETFDHIEDISEFVGVKRAAIRAHASQCAVMWIDEAVLGLNRYRGEMHSWPGGDYAEVFRRLR
jgi:LmbE family N-acetylglucosaminyl deacetylase